MHLFGIRVDATAFHAPEHAPVAILARRLDGRGVVATQLAQGLPGTRAEGLLEFGSVDLGEPDFDLLAIHKESERVAVADADHFSPQRVPGGRLGHQYKE